MLGRLPKIRRRSPGAVPAGPEGPAGALGAPLAPGAPAARDAPGPPAGADPPTAVLPVTTEPDAGTDPATAVPVSPSFRERGKLRRRLRYLRRVRELGYRDLGGLTFDLHRFGRDGTPLVREKLAALAAVDGELRAVERALGEERTFVDLREAGIAACPRCAALHGSEARFCPSCGIALVGPMAGVASASPAGMGTPPVPPTPLWGPAGPAAAQPGPGPAAGPSAPGATAPHAAAPAPPAGAAVFPGPVAPVPAEQPTQIVPAGGEPRDPSASPEDDAGAEPPPARGEDTDPELPPQPRASGEGGAGAQPREPVAAPDAHLPRP